MFYLIYLPLGFLSYFVFKWLYKREYPTCDWVVQDAILFLAYSLVAWPVIYLIIFFYWLSKLSFWDEPSKF